MPLDPSISLGVTGGANGLASAGAAAPVNPLAMAGNVADIQNKFNTNKAFQLSLAAKQKLGQIMASSPDIPTAIQRAQQDPAVAPFVPELVQTIAGTQNLAQEYKGKIQSQTADAFTHAASLLPGLVIDPAGAKAGIKSWINNIPDGDVKATVQSSMDHIMEALDDPSLDADGRMKAVTAAAVGIPGGLEAMKGLWAQPGVIDQGNIKQPVTVQGPVPTIAGKLPGSVTNVGNGLSLGLPPGAYSPDAVVAGGKYGGGSGGAPTGPIGGGATTPPADIPVSSSNGQPLVPADYKPPKSGAAGGIGGYSVSPQARELMKDHTGRDKEAYRNSQSSLTFLQEIDQDLDNMAKLDPGQDKNFMVPGAAAEGRTAIANTLNTVSNMFGGKSVVDPSKVASAEDLMKVTQRLGPSVLQSLLGQQREAAETIKNMNEKGVPGVNNTYLGGKLMTSTIRQAVQRQIDMYNFSNWYAAHNNQDLTGADAEFNRLNPAKAYIDRALNEYGLNESGFKTKDDLAKMVRMGYLTPKQASKQYSIQFGKKKE